MSKKIKKKKMYYPYIKKNNLKKKMQKQRKKQIKKGNKDEEKKKEIDIGLFYKFAEIMNGLNNFKKKKKYKLYIINYQL